MRRPPKPRAFRASKEAKRRARVQLGSPPPLRRQEIQKHKPPKHKKLDIEIAGED